MVKLSGINVCCSILVVSPLKSIIIDQIADIESLAYNVVELTEEILKEITVSPPQFIYCTAEKAIEKTFLNEMKRISSALRHDNSRAS